MFRPRIITAKFSTITIDACHGMVSAYSRSGVFPEAPSSHEDLYTMSTIGTISTVVTIATMAAIGTTSTSPNRSSTRGGWDVQPHDQLRALGIQEVILT